MGVVGWLCQGDGGREGEGREGKHGCGVGAVEAQVRRWSCRCGADEVLEC
jgi:hypothetical protein